MEPSIEFLTAIGRKKFVRWRQTGNAPKWEMGGKN